MISNSVSMVGYEWSTESGEHVADLPQQLQVSTSTHKTFNCKQLSLPWHVLPADGRVPVPAAVGVARAPHARVVAPRAQRQAQLQHAPVGRRVQRPMHAGQSHRLARHVTFHTFYKKGRRVTVFGAVCLCVCVFNKIPKSGCNMSSM